MLHIIFLAALFAFGCGIGAVVFMSFVVVALKGWFALEGIVDDWKRRRERKRRKATPVILLTRTLH